MTRDSRWPFIPFVALRAVQLLFAIIVLGETAYIVSEFEEPPWWPCLGLFTSLVAMLYCIATIVLYFTNLALPLALLIVDAFLLVFYLISMAGTADSGIVGGSCTYSYYSDNIYISDYTYSYTSTPCIVVKASFAFELLSMFLFIASTTLAAITMHKTRKDLRGKKHSQGLPPVSSAEQGTIPPQAAHAAVVPQQQQEQKVEQQYYPQEQQYVQGPPAQFVSPPTSPAPEQQVGGTQGQYTGHSTVSPLYNDNAHEMPGTGYQSMPPQQGHYEVPGTGYQQPPPQQGRSEMSGQ